MSPSAPNPEANPDQTIWTIGKVLTWTQRRFSTRGLASPRLDAELLISAIIGRSRVGIYTGFDQPLLPDELAKLRDLIRRRLQGESVAYLTGQKDFWTLSLQVSPAVLVPRPETETLVEVALQLLSTIAPAATEPGPQAEVAEKEPVPAETLAVYQRGAGDLTVQYDEFPLNDEDSGSESEADKTTEPGPVAAAVSSTRRSIVADIGTGSGAVALVLKKERPDLEVLAVDCSPAALEVARGNATRLLLTVDFLHGDLLTPLAGRGPLDLIVSNPPYIPTGEIPQLPAEVRHEPHLALDGGADGLSVVRRLVSGALTLLRPGGALAIEIGAGQAAAVRELLSQAGYVEVAARADLAGIDRVVSGRAPTP